MHLITATRGNIHDVNRLISELQGKYLPFEYEGKKALLSMLVQPIQLWSFVFPEPALQTVLHTIPDTNWHVDKSKLPFYAIRKALGAEKVPPMDKTTNGLPVYLRNTELMHIGIIKDKFNEKGECI